MSCRIERVVSDEHPVVVLISGRMTGEEVDLLRRTLNEEAKPPAIDLASVLLVDREAVELLAQSEADGSELRNCPLYVREWITRERKATKGRVSPELPERTEDKMLDAKRNPQRGKSGEIEAG